MDKEKLIEKIQNLLALSRNNPSIEEAATAGKMAQRLLQKYNLKEEFLRVAENQNEVEFSLKTEIIPLGKNKSTWKGMLLNGVAKINESTCWIEKTLSKEYYFNLLGEEHSIVVIRHMYHYLVGEIERLCKRDNEGFGKKWANNYKVACVSTVLKRLKEAKEKDGKEIKKELEEIAGKNGMSLTLVSTAIERRNKIEDQINEILSSKDLKPTKPKINLHVSAWEQGARAGEEIDLNTKNKLENGNKLKG